MDPKLKNWLVAQLRRISYRHWGRTQAKAQARIARGVYVCALCDGQYGVKEVQLDHIEPVVDPGAGWQGFDNYINRLFVPSTGYQVLCKPCHSKKTIKENARR